MNFKINDFFSKEEREKYCHNNIVTGVVIRTFFSEFSDNPKDKICILLGVDEENNQLGLLLINSSPPSWKQNDNYKGSQYLIQSTNYNYLDHDSYVDCTKIWDSRKYYEIFKECCENKLEFLGEINKRDLINIENILNISKFVSPKLKKRFLISYKN